MSEDSEKPDKLPILQSTSKGAITIRTAVPEDAEAVRPLRVHHLRHRPEGHLRGWHLLR